MLSTIISNITGIPTKQVENTLKLLADGATIPFISRYRKEATGALNEVQIEQIQDENERLSDIAKRKEAVLKSISEQGKLTDELRLRIENSWSLNEIEDIYLPFKPKKHTRAEMARQNGLEPLAKIIMSRQNASLFNIDVERFVSDKITEKDALKGAQDIISEWVSESETARERVRQNFEREGCISSKVIKGKESEADKYRDYFDINLLLKKCSSHKLLAMRRAEKEGFLRVSISPDDEKTCARLYPIFVKGDGEVASLVSDAVSDAYKRLIKPSIETEFATQSKQKADEEAIMVFAENLKQLLLSPPLGEKRVLAIDPGFRTGCKVVCLDAQGNLLHNETIFPHPPQNEKMQAARKIAKLVEAYKIDAISIGNGTAGRETEQFIQNISFDHKVQIFVVSEDGASIYSASSVAREEFPDYDVTVRGAVSIGRRLQDPLAELVKIDPKSIGVGQYQHDVDQVKLKKALDQTVINSVNKVGVNLNTASKHLLAYISGLGPQLAKNIVDYRAEKGAFTSRSQLKNVPRLGDKAFEQCAGFLRISGGDNPLDNTAVHPESYRLVETMAKDIGCSVSELIQNKDLKKKIDLKKYLSAKVGMPTLTDIMEEIDKPGRDSRQTVKVLEFDSNVRTIDDLKIGMVLNGIVTNITNFGAFVDFGIKENGLVHISEIANRYISNPTEAISLHQHVSVKVIGVDKERKRVQLSIKQAVMD